MVKKKAAEIAELENRLRTQVARPQGGRVVAADRKGAAGGSRGEGLRRERGGTLDVERAFDAALTEVAERSSPRAPGGDPERSCGCTPSASATTCFARARGLGRGEGERARLRARGSRRCGRPPARGRVALEDIDAGVRVEVGLLERSQTGQARRGDSIPAARDDRLSAARACARSSRRDQRRLARLQAHERLTEHARGTFGSVIVEGERRGLEPGLQLQAPLGYDFGEGPESSRGGHRVGRGRRRPRDQG